MSEFNWTPEEIAEIVNENRLVLFMKGTQKCHNVVFPIVPLRY